MKKIIVLGSGGGSNFLAVINNIKKGYIKDATVSLVISSKKDAGIIKKAKKEKIKTLYINNSREKINDKEGIKESELIKVLENEKPDLIVLAGYMRIVEKSIIKKFKGKIINIHPSLIPKYSGKGMYGLKPHEKVIENKDKESGATVHFVDEGVDTGEIILQRKIKVLKEDTAETLQKKVLEKIEHKILSEAINIVLKKGKNEQ